ncbi:hypothetical protein ACFQLX_04020 [Streptomyces polyrhachis]|uniref:Uncharacterized protein n=1 Tax=Streptomyces polyrhachis TaxID=1282885 RepID=A0ABW2GD75_9ACTN
MRAGEEWGGLDGETVERLLDGREVPGASADVRRLGAFLDGAREPLPVDPVRAESDRMAAMEAFREVYRAVPAPAPAAPPVRVRGRRRVLAGALATLAALLTAGGVAVASGGVAVPGFLGGGGPQPAASPRTPAEEARTPEAADSQGSRVTGRSPAPPQVDGRGASGGHRRDGAAKERRDLCTRWQQARARGRALTPAEQERLTGAARAHGRGVGAYCAQADPSGEPPTAKPTPNPGRGETTR